MRLTSKESVSKALICQPELVSDSEFCLKSNPKIPKQVRNDSSETASSKVSPTCNYNI